VKVAPSTSTLKVVNGPTMSFSTRTTLEEQLVSPLKINYFANLPSDSDESDDEFDLYTIFCPSNSSNIHLSHTRALAHCESSSNIVKAKILELEKMVSIYQSNMDEFERTKNELSKCKSENYATLFRAPRRLGRWTAEEGYGDPSKCALGYIYMNLKCTFKGFLVIVGSLRFQLAQAPIVNYPGF
jgi:hypothetical protein